MTLLWCVFCWFLPISVKYFIWLDFVFDVSEISLLKCWPFHLRHKKIPEWLRMHLLQRKGMKTSEQSTVNIYMRSAPRIIIVSSRFKLSSCASLNWQLACQFSSANHLSYRIQRQWKLGTDAWQFSEQQNQSKLKSFPSQVSCNNTVDM